jgi:hypothetical protein
MTKICKYGEETTINIVSGMRAGDADGGGGVRDLRGKDRRQF